jgi:cysteine synthase A
VKLVKYNNVLETIGNTPHVRINRLFGKNHEVWLKLERQNPGGSIKDRIGLAMIEDAERRGVLTTDTVIVEPTSGNTGIGLALGAAVKGYRIILVMPDSMSVERRRILAALGAELVLTPREKGISLSIERAGEIAAQQKKAWIPQQFENPANLEVHRRTTAQEILADFPEGIDYFITSYGTGGHITAVSEVLKKKFSKMKTFCVEPEKSTVASGGTHSPHKLQGIAPGFVPRIMNRDLIDGYIQVSEDEGFDFARRAMKEEGIFVGPSSGGTLAGVNKKLAELPKGSRVLAVSYDTGERYLSIEGLFPAGQT